jgi:hypothetical protein
MVIDDFDLTGAIVLPFEAYVPLAIDPDGMLPAPFAAKHFQAVGWRNSQIRQRFGKMQHRQLSRSQALDVLRELFREAAEKDFIGFAAFE